MGVYHCNARGEDAVFGVAVARHHRGFDARGGAVHHAVVSAATEISHHGLTCLLPTSPPGPPVGAPPVRVYHSPAAGHPCSGHEVLIHHSRSRRGTSGAEG